MNKNAATRKLRNKMEQLFEVSSTIASLTSICSAEEHIYFGMLVAFAFCYEAPELAMSYWLYVKKRNDEYSAKIGEPSPITLPEQIARTLAANNE